MKLFVFSEHLILASVSEESILGILLLLFFFTSIIFAKVLSIAV